MHATDNLVTAADNLLAGIALHAGATVNVSTGGTVDIASGYLVSIDGYGMWWPDTIGLESVVQDYVNRAAGEWIPGLHAGNPVYVGAWRDDETSVVHLDLSCVFTGREFALQVAREQRQLAVWDCAASQEIRVDTIDYSGDDDEVHPEARVNLHKGYAHHSDIRNPLSTYNRGRVTLRKEGI